MTLPNSIAAAHYSRLAVSTKTAAITTALATPTEANLKACFDLVADYLEILNIRDMPQIGTPANIVNVPVYGQAMTSTVNAQSDAPSLELTVNFIPSHWDPSSSSSNLGKMVADGNSKIFQFAFLTAKSADLATGTAGGLKQVFNALYYFVGRIESCLINPARDDAATATVTLSIQSPFYGPYTVS